MKRKRRAGSPPTLGIFRNSEYGPKTSVKDRQIRGSLENCCASASDPKIKVRRIRLLRTFRPANKLYDARNARLGSRCCSGRRHPRPGDLGVSLAAGSSEPPPFYGKSNPTNSD